MVLNKLLIVVRAAQNTFRLTLIHIFSSSSNMLGTMEIFLFFLSARDLLLKEHVHRYPSKATVHSP